MFRKKQSTAETCPQPGCTNHSPDGWLIYRQLFVFSLDKL